MLIEGQIDRPSTGITTVRIDVAFDIGFYSVAQFTRLNGLAIFHNSNLHKIINLILVYGNVKVNIDDFLTLKSEHCVVVDVAQSCLDRMLMVHDWKRSLKR